MMFQRFVSEKIDSSNLNESHQYLVGFQEDWRNRMKRLETSAFYWSQKLCFNLAQQIWLIQLIVNQNMNYIDLYDQFDFYGVIGIMSNIQVFFHRSLRNLNFHIGSYSFAQICQLFIVDSGYYILLYESLALFLEAVNLPLIQIATFVSVVDDNMFQNFLTLHFLTVLFNTLYDCIKFIVNFLYLLNKPLVFLDNLVNYFILHFHYLFLKLFNESISVLYQSFANFIFILFFRVFCIYQHFFNRLYIFIKPAVCVQNLFQYFSDSIYAKGILLKVWCRLIQFMLVRVKFDARRTYRQKTFITFTEICDYLHRVIGAFLLVKFEWPTVIITAILRFWIQFVVQLLFLHIIQCYQIIIINGRQKQGSKIIILFFFYIGYWILAQQISFLTRVTANIDNYLHNNGSIFMQFIVAIIHCVEKK